MSPTAKRRCVVVIVGLLILGGALAWFGWYKFFREEPEPTWSSEAERFMYGSIGAENDRGLPYYIWLVLPRIFPDLLPGPGGYKAFGLVWEEGREMPVGFTKRVIGFPRTANNCAICHTGTWRAREDETPHLIVAAPAHTVDVQGFLRFLINCGNDSRFNASTLLGEIEREVKLSMIDRQLYRFLIIPATRKALRQQGQQLAFMNRPGWPDWGRGRDDPMNLTKYFMTDLPMDESTGQADFPSIWNLKVRKGDGLFLNWSCDTPAVRSVLIDSALGLGARPNDWFRRRMEELEVFLSDLPPPRYPFPVATNVAYTTGKQIYDRHCAECHDPGRPRTNKPILIADVGTDRERMDTWTQAAADEANSRVKSLGIDRPNMVKQEGYQAIPLDGIWMRAPYLHNGSVANLRELLEPVDRRTRSFIRGNDLYDPVNVGFSTNLPPARHTIWRLDAAERGNGNQGHLWGVDLPQADKAALLEYLKTL